MYLIKIYSAGFSTGYMTSRRSLFSVQAGSGAVWVTPFGSFSRHSHLLRQWQPFMVKVTFMEKNLYINCEAHRIWECGKDDTKKINANF